MRKAEGCVYPLTAIPAVSTPALRGEARTRVAVVGGGYTGLSAALHLAERGVEVTLLEAHEPGWGAAGRNGGQVNPGLKHEPDDVERDLGSLHGARLVQLAGGAPEFLFDLIDRLGISCEARREGTIRAAYRSRDLDTLRASARQWQRRGVALEHWDAVRVAAATGAQRYLAASFDRRGGSVNPLGLARGLSAAAIAAGARIHGHSRVTRLEPSGTSWCAITPEGRLHAETLILATDGYTDDLWPGLRTSIIPVYSTLIATAPLSSQLAAIVMRHNGVLYECGDITVYYRRDAANRLLIGGRGRQRPLRDSDTVAHLARYAERLWPALRGVDWPHRWNGQFALTPDFYPHFHNPVQNVFIALGYSGRGVALGTAIGGELAAAAMGQDLDTLALPVTDIKRIPLHAFWKIGVAARVAYGRLRS